MTAKRFTRALLVIELGLASQAALAGYTFEEGSLKGELNLAAGAATISTKEVKFGAGRVDSRTGENTGTTADWQEIYLKPGMKLSYSLNPDVDLLGGASVVGTRTFDDGDAAGFTRGGDGDVATEELYAGIKSGAWKFTGGRQNYKIGTGFIVMNGNFNNQKDGAYWMSPRSAFRDSAILRWAGGDAQAQAFTLRTDDDMGDFRMSGANLDYTLPGTATLGAMAMKVKSLDLDFNQIVPRDGMQVYNLRALKTTLPDAPNLTLNGEYAIQRGSGQGIHYDASAWYAQADYAFVDVPLQPILGYRHARFSGDEDLTDNQRKSWNSLSKGFSDWSTWLIGDVVGNYLLNNSNERVNQYSLKTQLNPALTLGAIHYQFSLDVHQYKGIPVSDRRFADESVIYLDWTPTKEIYTSLAYNLVQPKTAAKETLGDKNFSALEFYVSYHY